MEAFELLALVGTGLVLFIFLFLRIEKKDICWLLRHKWNTNETYTLLISEEIRIRSPFVVPIVRCSRCEEIKGVAI